MGSLRTAPRAGHLARSLLLLWALVLALAAVPCSAAADPAYPCDHCTDHAANHGSHGAGDTCLHCDSDPLAAPAPAADDRAGGASPAAAAPAAPLLAVAEQAAISRPAVEARPPDVRPYLTTRRLRL